MKFGAFTYTGKSGFKDSSFPVRGKSWKTTGYKIVYFSSMS